MNAEGLILEQKYVVKLESETFRGLSQNIVNGTLKVYSDGVIFQTDDTIMDVLGNKIFTKGLKIKNIEGGMLIIPKEHIKRAYKNSFKIVFMQHSLHIELKDNQTLMFRMQPAQADNLAKAIHSVL